MKESFESYQDTSKKLDHDMVTWLEDGTKKSAQWRTATNYPSPSEVVVTKDTIKADQAYQLAFDGKALLWRSDFPNARSLLQALSRRSLRQPRSNQVKNTKSFQEIFFEQRAIQEKRARVLNQLLVPLSADYVIQLPRAQDVALACEQVFGSSQSDSVISLRALLAIVSAHEWRKKGVQIPQLSRRIYPHFGVFSPLRSEYLDLVDQAPLSPNWKSAYDIGTGTGVLAAILAKRGLLEITATDLYQRAVLCARANILLFEMQERIQVIQSDMFPPGRADVIVCNPPWIVAEPSSLLDSAVYDSKATMLRSFLSGVRDHLNIGGEAWLVISDIAEHLDLRSRDQFLEWIALGGLKVVGRIDARPVHGRARDQEDPLYQVRSKEITSLWRLQSS